MVENNVNTEILIPDISESEFLVTNKFTAKYKFYAVGDIEAPLELTVRRNEFPAIETEIHARAFGVSIKQTELDIKHRGNSYVLTEIQPMGFIDYPTEIEVRPHNMMSAIYETQRPPIITSVLKPTQDSFTREKSEYSSINYGSSSSMVVGRDNGDIWRSFIQFDFSSINPSYILTESKLRLYYKGSTPKDLKLELLNADSQWYEYSITNLNRPAPIKLISNEFTVNSEKGYIEFEIMDIVKSWLSKAQDNNGFIIRMANESVNGQTTFFTRETSFAPELEIKYYDSTVFSQGRTQIPTEIYIKKLSDKNVNTELEVHSTHRFEKVNTQLYVHRAEVPLEDDILTEITSNVVSNEVILVVSKPVKLEVETEITTRVPEINSKETEISVSRNVVESELYVKHKNDNEIEFVVRASNSNNILTELAISRPIVPTEIIASIRREEDVLTEISTRKPHVDLEITVSKPSVLTELNVKIRGNQYLYASVDVTKPTVESELYVKHRTDILTEITANIKSDVYTEIIVINTSVATEITPRLFAISDVESEIFVKYESDILTEIEFKAVSQVLTEIFARSVSQVSTEIIHSKDRVVTAITIPTWVDLDMVTEIQPRIFMVNNVNTIIVTGKIMGAYGFIL